jgi:ubiquinone/menaquinone biosynthesis C-methylase UbiE
VYRLAEDAAVFLDKRSPAYLGGSVEFLLSPHIMRNFGELTERVRKGGAPEHQENGSMEPNSEMWMRFARGMAGLMTMPGQMLAKQLLAGRAAGPMKVLDIAAGHGMFGIAVAQQNPQAQVVGLDWENVLGVAKENAAKFGVAGRYSTIAGSALEVDLGREYDLVLVPNFLHHFDRGTDVGLLKRVHGALKAGGRVGVLEFAPNEDRVTPPACAGFALVMLAGTPHGDAYTVSELTGMLQEAGFKDVTWSDLPTTMQRVIVGTK